MGGGEDLWVREEPLDIMVEIGRASSCLHAWRDLCKLRKFHKVCVFAFRERALVRATRVALLGWRRYTAQRLEDARQRSRASIRRKECQARESVDEPLVVGRRERECERKEEEQEEEITSAFTAELEKLKMQAALNFFATRFLRRVLLQWRVAVRNGVGSEKRRAKEVERERKHALAARKFCRIMSLHKAFNSWNLAFKSRNRVSRLNTDKEYRALKMQQVLLEKRKELQAKSSVCPKLGKENLRPATGADTGKPRPKASGLEATEVGRPEVTPTRRSRTPGRKHQSAELELSLRKLASRRAETTLRSRPDEGESGRRIHRPGLPSPSAVPPGGRDATPSTTPAGRTKEGEDDLRRKLDERAKERIQRRKELRKRYEEKLSVESEETEQEKHEAKSYERRIRELQRIEAKERVYRLELEESERISKMELRQQQLSLAKMHHRRWLMGQVGLRAFKCLAGEIRSKEASANAKYGKHLLAVAMQGWKVYTMPFWRRKMLFHVHLHGVLHRFLTRYRLERVLSTWLDLVNAKKFKRHRIAKFHFSFFKDLVKRREGQRVQAASFHAKRVLRDHLEVWKDYTSVRAELVLLHELQVAHAFRQEYRRGLARRVFEDWRFATRDLKRERKIEMGKRETWSKINQWLEEIDKDKAEKKELERKVNGDKSSLLQYLSRDFSVPLSFEKTRPIAAP
ncbi:hypothetical protein HOP50_04g31200 [Chloropicon primus]|uniref:Sfi1 spindle body domain-containing protein n=2 Tax=Chloropicon primus TaxID=1764295 RepID=A0A5B8MMR8_9CHLO|nr:hypothetical protein A3770_04p31180 [Chloropicon primus]UPQ99811.1 hypothetical protein HOP50_04g31200 [Chloropicon primus]|eukprot:QDZ20600.1 hypothetical protein A3770_04p31180 [Chloropicon primus]